MFCGKRLGMSRRHCNTSQDNDILLSIHDLFGKAKLPRDGGKHC
jgi:hypothetical protein